jgi:hypothetical protein
MLNIHWKLHECKDFRKEKKKGLEEFPNLYGCLGVAFLSIVRPYFYLMAKFQRRLLVPQPHI